MEPSGASSGKHVEPTTMVRRFESVRRLCKVPANSTFSIQLDLEFKRAVGMEPLMELPGPRTAGGNDRVGPYPSQWATRHRLGVVRPVRARRARLDAPAGKRRRSSSRASHSVAEVTGRAGVPASPSAGRATETDRCYDWSF